MSAVTEAAKRSMAAFLGARRRHTEHSSQQERQIINLGKEGNIAIADLRKGDVVNFIPSLNGSDPVLSFVIQGPYSYPDEPMGASALAIMRINHFKLSGEMYPVPITVNGPMEMWVRIKSDDPENSSIGASHAVSYRDISQRTLPTVIDPDSIAYVVLHRSNGPRIF